MNRGIFFYPHLKAPKILNRKYTAFPKTTTCNNAAINIPQSPNVKGNKFRKYLTYSVVLFGTLSVSLWSFSYIIDSIPETKLWFKKKVEEELSKKFQSTITISSPITIDLISGNLRIHSMRMKSLPTHLPYSDFDFTIQNTKILFSLIDFLKGYNQIECEMEGLRGIVDKRHLKNENYNENDWSNLHNWKFQSSSNFSFKSTTIKDAIFTIIINDQTSHNVNIISADFPILRPTHLLIDLMMANSVSGILNGNCLFSIHKPPLLDNGDSKRLFKLHSLPVSLLTKSMIIAYETTSPLSWITRGLVDVDIMIDHKDKQFDFDVQLQFHNLHAKIPSSRRSYPSQTSSIDPSKHKGHNHLLIHRTLMRPIVAYLNEQKPFIPLHCHWSTPTHQLEGCWTLWESGLLEELSLSISDSFYKVIVKRELMNSGRVKLFSLWSLYALLRGVLFTTPQIITTSS